MGVGLLSWTGTKWDWHSPSGIEPSGLMPPARTASSTARSLAPVFTCVRACVRAQVRVQQKHIPGSPFKLSVVAGAFSLCQCVQHSPVSCGTTCTASGPDMCAATVRPRPFLLPSPSGTASGGWVRVLSAACLKL